ncbi:MAG: hypothetical protein ACXWZT_04030, partial [Gaiellaceae bacterium]
MPSPFESAKDLGYAWYRTPPVHHGCRGEAMSNATLANVDRALLQLQLSEHGEPPYRAGQVWEWAARGATGYEQMTNLPDSLRGRL